MVRSVVAEAEHVEDQVDGLLKQGSSAKTGLLIGKVGVASRDHIYALLPTPPSDSSINGIVPGDASKKKGKAEEPLHVDVEWIEEHTRQVSRMLPGGLMVLGLYAICSEAALKAAGGKLWEALTAIAASSGPRIASEDAGTEWLLLHISPQPRKFTCRSGPVGSSAGGFQSLRPCELKFGHNLSTLHRLHASYQLDLWLPIQPANSATLRTSVQNAISFEAARLAAAQWTVDGTLGDPSQTVATLRVPPSDLNLGNQTPPSHEVSFFSRPSWGSEAGPKLGEEVMEKPGPITGHLELRGAVHVEAYSHPKQTLGEALADIRQDLIRSLQARLDLIVEEAERVEEEEETSASTSAGREDAQEGVTSQPRHPLLEEGAGGKAGQYREGLPRRVLVPWLAGVQLSEYLMESESRSEVAERCREMLGSSFDGAGGGSEFILIEGPAVYDNRAQKQSERREATVHGPSTGSGKMKEATSSVCTQATMAATAGALAAASLAIGLAYTLR